MDVPKNVIRKKKNNFSSGKQFVEQWLSFIAWIKSQLHILGVLHGKWKERKWEWAHQPVYFTLQYLCHNTVCISSQAVYNVKKSHLFLSWPHYLGRSHAALWEQPTIETQRWLSCGCVCSVLTETCDTANGDDNTVWWLISPRWEVLLLRHSRTFWKHITW